LDFLQLYPKRFRICVNVSCNGSAAIDAASRAIAESVTVDAAATVEDDAAAAGTRDDAVTVADDAAADDAKEPSG
jgi:hypothetical protein